MLIEMKVAGLTIDPITNTPIVILKNIQESKAIPIWIGLLEASAIATELEKIVFPRPMTHDLLNECLKSLNVTVNKIEIVDMELFLQNANKSMFTIQPEIVKPNLTKIKAYYKMTQRVPAGTQLIEGEEKFNIKLNEVNNGTKETGIGAEQTNSYRDAV